MHRWIAGPAAILFGLPDGSRFVGVWEVSVVGLRLRLFLCSVLVLLGASACTIFESNDLASPGLIYYLPRTELTVTITPWGVPKSKLQDIRDLRSEATKEVASGPLDREYADPRRDEIHYLDITLSPTNVADIRRPFSLQYQRNPFTTDQVCSGIKDGLLLAVEAASADETANIVVSIAALAGRFIGPAPFADVSRGETIKFTELSHHKLVMSIDPLNPGDLKELSRRIREKYNLDYELSFPDAEYLRPSAQLASCPQDSVCYRTAVPLRYHFRGTGRLGVNRKGPSTYEHSKSDTVMVVNQAFTGHVDVTRAFMVEKITRLEFAGGVLKSVAIRKPSEALATAKLPLAVVDAVMTSVLAAPGKFLSNIGGLPPSEQLALIKQAQDNAIKVKDIEQTLASLRNADFLASGPLARVAPAEDLFKIRCHGTFVAPKS